MEIVVKRYELEVSYLLFIEVEDKGIDLKLNKKLEVKVVVYINIPLLLKIEAIQIQPSIRSNIKTKYLRNLYKIPQTLHLNLFKILNHLIYLTLRSAL